MKTRKGDLHLKRAKEFCNRIFFYGCNGNDIGVDWGYHADLSAWVSAVFLSTEYCREDKPSGPTW